jgi:superoxide reductase
MTDRYQVYKCEKCNNIVEVMHKGPGTLVCCGQPMALYTANTTDAAQEKHVPVVEKMGDGYQVKVGSASHPMEEKHFIEWIELIADGEVHRRFLEPGQDPKADFQLKAQDVTARAYCNLHGLWKK